MVKTRLIATLLVDSGRIVQTCKFKRTNMVGSAFTAVDFFNSWSVDEICVLEISHSREYLNDFHRIIEGLSERCFVPLSVGGKIQSLDDVYLLLRLGADKIVLNTAAVENPGLIKSIADEFGSQCVIVSIDAKESGNHASGYTVYTDNGQKNREIDVLDWVNTCVELGAGEFLINSIEHDGNREGYDNNLLKLLTSNITNPVIAMGGVGKWEHMVDAINQASVSAVAAGNIFHYTEHSTKKAKEFLELSNLNVRPSTFYKLNKPRKIKYKIN